MSEVVLQRFRFGPVHHNQSHVRRLSLVMCNYIKAALCECCPLPMTHPLWRTYRSDIALDGKTP
nr:hypothetical protein [Tanacetum cinerariifolium]